MSFERTSAELVKNTSTVSPTTLPTVKDALDSLGASIAALGIASGSFTPTMAFATPGTSSFSYATQTGRYLKVGTWYIVEAILTVTPTIGTGSGAVRLGGLPASSGFNMAGWVSETPDALTLSAGYTWVGARFDAGNPWMFLEQNGSAVAGGTISAASLTTGVAQTYRYGGAFTT